MHTGHRPERVEQASLEFESPLDRHVGALIVDDGHYDSSQVEPALSRRQILQRPREEQRRHDQRERERDLRNHETATRTARPSIIRRRASRRPEECAVRWAGRKKSRCRPEEHARDERDGRSKEQHSPIGIEIERHAEELKAAGAQESNQPFAQGLRQEDSDNSASGREERTLDQQLTYQPATRGAECEPHGDLAFAGRGAREQQRRDIRGGDDEHHAGNCEQHPEWRLIIFPNRSRYASRGRKRVERRAEIRLRHVCGELQLARADVELRIVARDLIQCAVALGVVVARVGEPVLRLPLRMQQAIQCDLRAEIHGHQGDQ